MSEYFPHSVTLSGDPLPEKEEKTVIWAACILRMFRPLLGAGGE